MAANFSDDQINWIPVIYREQKFLNDLLANAEALQRKIINDLEKAVRAVDNNEVYRVISIDFLN